MTELTDEEQRAIIDAIPRRYFYPMVLIARYDSSGRITQYGTMSLGTYEDLLDENARIILRNNVEQTDETHYVLDGVLTPRPEPSEFDKTTIIAGGVDVATMEYIPAGSRVELYDIEANRLVGVQTHSGGNLEIAITESGNYNVFVDAFPAKSVTITIEAVEE